MNNENNKFLEDEWKKKFFRTYFDIDADKETLNNCLDYKNNHGEEERRKYRRITHQKDSKLLRSSSKSSLFESPIKLR